MNEFLIYNTRINGRRQANSKNKNRKKMASIHKDKGDAIDVYQKAIEEYEEYKRISKHNIQDSVGEESTNEANCKLSNTSKADSKISAVHGKALHNAGRSVLTYKKLVSSIKSPYISGAVIDNLNRAYYPSKVKKIKKGHSRKKKSSTPNIKARKHQNPKEYIPVLKQVYQSSSVEQAEIDQLRFKRQLEEQEVLKRQRENIEELKKLQNQNDGSISVVQERHEENDDVTTVMADKLDVENENQRSIVSQPVETQFEIPLDELEVKHSAVEINESEDDESNENNEDQDDDIENVDLAKHLDDVQITPEKTPNLGKRSKSDKLEELPTNVIVASDQSPVSGSAKKKTKQKQVPKTIKRIFPNVTDVGQWRKRNRLTKQTKIFKMIGNYNSIKKAFNERGWVENKDKTSPWFDLLWTLKLKDIDYESLKDGQIVNHFRFNGAITTKVGLWRNLGKVINFSNVDIDTFFPKWYALKDEGEWEEFSEQFKVYKAEAVLRRFLNNEIIDPDMLDIAMTVWRRNLLELDEIIDNPYKQLVSESEWYTLRKDEKKKSTKNKYNDKRVLSLVPMRRNKISNSPSVTTKKINSKRDITNKSPSIVMLILPEIENKQMYSTVKERNRFLVDQSLKEDAIRSMIENRTVNEESVEEKPDTNRVTEVISTYKKPPADAHKTLKSDVKHIWERLNKKFPQYKINGGKNIWIAKPAGLSRGRGIEVFSNLEDIYEYTGGKDKNWIIQKYIENPLIINQRKFDIRIWVFVTDLNPLTIWFWNKPYIRFPAANYTDENLHDRFIHLTNNSVAKNAKHLEIVGDGNMWYIEQLQDHLKTTYGRDIWEEDILPKVKDIIIYSLQSVQDMLDTRKGSMELLGYDIMIDDQFNPWLIEVNSSPTMEYR